MSEGEGTVRPLRPGSPTSSGARETAESVLPGLPRVGALDALLREVDGLRLTLETDLSLAAAAVEAGAPQIAGDIIDSDRASLRRFESRALDHLAELSAADLAPPEIARRSWWRRVPATPFVAAAAVVSFLVMVAPQTGQPSGSITATQVSAGERLQEITDLAASGQTNGIRNAAANLHSQLLALVAQAKTDPVAAQRGLQLLLDERAIISQSGDSQSLGDVLAASNTLTTLILNALPRTAVPKAPRLAAVVPTVAPSSKPSASPSAKASTKPSAKPSVQPSASPAPQSSSSSQPAVLPTGPAVGP
jgi:hypothetical protein